MSGYQSNCGIKYFNHPKSDYEESKARRSVRNNNFTQQTNALDVDKHMCVLQQLTNYFINISYTRMAYIEENLKLRRGKQDVQEEQGSPKPLDPQEELYRLPENLKAVAKKQQEEGSVTNSLSMLTAIPEVDLGMEYVYINP